MAVHQIFLSLESLVCLYRNLNLNLNLNNSEQFWHFLVQFGGISVGSRSNEAGQCMQQKQDCVNGCASDLSFVRVSRWFSQDFFVVQPAGCLTLKVHSFPKKFHLCDLFSINFTVVIWTGTAGNIQVTPIVTSKSLVSFVSMKCQVTPR